MDLGGEGPIEDLRASCREYGSKSKAYEPESTYQPDITSGDGGLVLFTLSGAQAVMVNDQYICGGECLRGANCSNRNSYNIAIYVRSEKTWRKVLATDTVGEDHKHVTVRTIKMEEKTADKLRYSSKFNRSHDFMDQMRKEGRVVARDWLDRWPEKAGCYPEDAAYRKSQPELGPKCENIAR